MFETIIWITAGAFIGYALSGTRKLVRIRKLKNELLIKSEQCDAGGATIAKLHVDLSKERDKTRDFRRDLVLWEQLANKIVNHQFFPQKRFKTVPETGLELLKEMEAVINAAHVLIDQDLRHKNGEDVAEMRDWIPKAEKFVELTMKKQ